MDRLSSLEALAGKISPLSKEPDPDSIKMFVGQVPRSMDETELIRMFQVYGPVYQLNVLRDKTSGVSRGCCFVTFYKRKDALEAQNALHNMKILPGMHHPIQMKPADTENRNERKLFIGMVSKRLNEDDIKKMFAAFGGIEECSVLRDDNGISRGCAFVTFTSRSVAATAIKAMHHSQTMEGCSSPLVVKFADTQKEKEQKKLQQLQSNVWTLSDPSSTTQALVGTPLVVNSPLPQLSQQQISQLPSQQIVPQTPLVLPYQDVLTAQYSSLLNQPVSGLDGLQNGLINRQLLTGGHMTNGHIDPVNQPTINSFSLPVSAGLSSPGSLGQQAAHPLLQNLALYQQLGLQGQLGGVPLLPQHLHPSSLHGLALSLPSSTSSDILLKNNINTLPLQYVSLPGGESNNHTEEPIIKSKELISTEKKSLKSKDQDVPNGANLFIYHLPPEFTDADLMDTFQPFGSVVSSRVFIDKQTNLSKCFGFVSFTNTESANRAIQAMNGFQIGTKRLKVQLKKSRESSKPY